MIIDPYTWHRLQIQQVTQLTPDTISLVLPRPKNYTFRAGQYAIVRVTVDKTPLLRQYSFASSPHSDQLELLVQRETEGEVSGWLHQAATVGSTLEISQAFGSFTWDNTEEPVLMIAGRVGIAPFISIVREHEFLTAKSPVSVLYSVRETQQICLPEILDRVKTTYFVTSEGERITDDVIKKQLQPDTHVYICGSKRFVDGITDVLLALDVPASRIKRELFTLQ